MSNIYRKAVLSRSQRRPKPQPREENISQTNQQTKINLHQTNNFQSLGFGHNHVVPKRNIFTAHFKNEQNTSDLVFASNLIPKKQPIKRFNQTAKQGFRNNLQRPQSKQEPRSKGWNKSGLLPKSSLIQTSIRPQTSKGIRPRVSYKQKAEDFSQRTNIEQGDQLKVGMQLGHGQKKSNDGFLISSTLLVHRGINKVRFDFNSSIDPEFLSLFAN